MKKREDLKVVCIVCGDVFPIEEWREECKQYLITPSGMAAVVNGGPTGQVSGVCCSDCWSKLPSYKTVL